MGWPWESSDDGNAERDQFNSWNAANRAKLNAAVGDMSLDAATRNELAIGLWDANQSGTGSPESNYSKLNRLISTLSQAKTQSGKYRARAVNYAASNLNYAQPGRKQLVAGSTPGYGTGPMIHMPGFF